MVAAKSRQSDGKGEKIILLVENDESDVFFFRRAAAQAGYGGDIRVVGGVSEAMAYLENTGEFTDLRYHRRPDLIVCDLRLTGETALSFLLMLRASSTLSAIPVVIHSAASRELHYERLQAAGAKAFLEKTSDMTEFTEVLRRLLRSI